MIAREGRGIIISVLVLCAFFLTLHMRFLAVLLLVLLILLIFFFRDPKRVPPEIPKAFVSPADGLLVEIKKQEDIIRVSIFMSVFNVHVNRIPYEGKVVRIEPRKGKFLRAFKNEAEIKNEQVRTCIKSEFGEYEILQIAGIFARRIVNNLKPGQNVKKGDRIGMIKFGSRVSVTFPEKEFEIIVKETAKVKAGITILAKARK